MPKASRPFFSLVVSPVPFGKDLHAVYEIVEIRNPWDGNPIEGFLLDRSKNLLLLHRIAVDVICLNGYSVISRRDIRKMKVQRGDCLLARALSLKQISPAKPTDISIGSWPELLESVDRQFPLFTIYMERLDPDVCYIGRLAARSATTFGLKEIDINARWTRSRSYKFADLTSVDFGGGYENALASLAATPVRRKRGSIRTIRSSGTT